MDDAMSHEALRGEARINMIIQRVEGDRLDRAYQMLEKNGVVRHHDLNIGMPLDALERAGLAVLRFHKGGSRHTPGAISFHDLFNVPPHNYVALRIDDRTIEQMAGMLRYPFTPHRMTAMVGRFVEAGLTDEMARKVVSMAKEMDERVDPLRQEVEFALQHLVRQGVTPERARRALEERLEKERLMEADHATKILRGKELFSKRLVEGASIGEAARYAARQTGSERSHQAFG